METKLDRLRVGPYVLVKPLDGGVTAERWIALDHRTQATHLAYRFPVRDERGDVRRFLAGVESLSRLRHPHILPVETFALGVEGGGKSAGVPGAWVVSPFTGNLDGLVTLASLQRQKGGRVPASEAERALMQLLEAVDAAHVAGHVHGPLRAEEILVDPRGSLAIELYGLRRRLSPVLASSGEEAARDEIRSVVAMGYQLLTGIAADEPLIGASRLVPGLDRRWDAWFAAGLDPLNGFGSAEEALASLPANRRELDATLRRSPVQTVLARVRQALGVP